MAFLGSLDIAASGITAQKKRMDVISENIVNRETTRTAEGGPYRRKLTVFQEIPSQSRFASRLKSESLRYREKSSASHGGVMVREIIEDQSEMIPVYDPNHPDANEEGYVMMPNVDNTKEMVDAMAASRSYEANITAFNAMKAIALKALEIGK
ncbi:flagellar basal body rod protein FlgC [Oscillospiraceae bacterium MB08-C2-2]|nr:flagellar basal body rod protein FlgC [Oscillospiraceae bacterium MB08-C2-2]